MFTISDYQFTFLEMFGYVGNFIFILIIFGFSYLIPGFLLSKSYFLVRDKFKINAKRRKINFTLIIFFGFLFNLLIFFITASTNLLNKVWTTWTICSIVFILFVILDLYQTRWKLKKYFSLWKIRMKKIFDFIITKKNWFLTFIILGVLLYTFSSFILPYPPGEDMMGHSLYVQLIYEQNAILPLLNSKISPLIISTNQVYYPMFSHYVAVISYSLVKPITGILSPTFMNCYYKIWLLILPITFRETITKIFNKRVGYVSSILLFLFAPSMFIIWRWGGFSFAVGLVFLSVAIFNILDYDYYNIDYYIICSLSLLFTFLNHTVVFTFCILTIFAIALHNIILRLSNEYRLLTKNNKRMYILANIAIFIFISFQVLSEVIIFMQKNKDSIINNLVYYAVLGTLSFIFIAYVIINQLIILKNENIKSKKNLHKFFKSLNFFSIISTVIMVFLLILYINNVNEYIANMNITRIVKFLFKEKSKEPVISFNFIRIDPIFNFKSRYLTAAVQVLANVYINGILFFGGMIFVGKHLKENGTDYRKAIFYLLAGITVVMFVIYGLGQIEVLSFLNIKFYFANYLIRYERLFVIFNIIITPAFSAYFLVHLEETLMKNQSKYTSTSPPKLNKIKHGYFKRMNVYNTIIVILISTITIGTYTYAGFFGTNLYYSNDHSEATEWILSNTDEDDWFIVDRYGSWISFSANRKVSFIFLTGSSELPRSQEITKKVIRLLEENTVFESIMLRIKGYCYLYLSELLPNDVQNIFYTYYGEYYTFEYFENIPSIDIVYRGEYDMILYLNVSSFTNKDYVEPGVATGTHEFTIL